MSLIDADIHVQTLSAHKFESGPIVVDNEEDEKFTVVNICEGKERVTALLDVASAMTGIGVIIHEAIIQASARLHTRMADLLHFLLELSSSHLDWDQGPLIYKPCPCAKNEQKNQRSFPN